MRLILFVLLTSFFLTPQLCIADSWTRMTDFPGGARHLAYSFVIGNMAYLGGGGVNDFWEYDPSLDVWTPKSNPPFSLVVWPVGIAIGNFGYAFTDSNEFWQYNPLTDSWARKADLPGAFRPFPTSFVVGGKAYIGGGIAGSSFFCYDPATNSWTSIASAPLLWGEAFGFTANSKGYVSGIYSTGGFLSPEVLEYDPAADSWAQKADFPGPPRTDLSTFNIGNIAYLGVGDTLLGGQLKDWWQYNAYTDSWVQKASIPSTLGKDEDPAFAVNHKGYVCFGADTNPNAEIWQYTPDSVTEVREIAIQFQTNLHPNPATTGLIISTKGRITSIAISDFLGQTVYRNQYNSTHVQVDIADLPPGVYFVTVNGSEIKKFIKQ